MGVLSLSSSELALDLSHLQYELHVAEHVPGVTNTIADALSRLNSPEGCTRLPEVIKGATQRRVPVRDDKYFLVARAAR